MNIIYIITYISKIYIYYQDYSCHNNATLSWDAVIKAS